MSLTIILIVITVVVSLIAFSKESVMKAMMMNPYLIQHKHQYYRFISSGFIHANQTHLFVNMFSFYFFGTAMETVFYYLFGNNSGYYFITLYLLAIVVSDLPTFFKQKNNPAYNSLGASGGVAALILAFIIFQPLQHICIYIAFCMPGFIVGILFIGFSYYQGRKSGSIINHDAHLYGALFGLLFCLVIYPSSLLHFYEQVKNWVYSW